MIPFLTYPLALLALTTLPALAAIYVLRNRFRRRRVSSLVLWGFSVQSRAGGAKIHRLQLPLLFFLELLILLLLVVAAAGPHRKTLQSSRPLVVVLDDSFSMRAMADGKTIQQQARDYLEQLYRRQPPLLTRVIIAGTDPRLAGEPARSWAEVSAVLPQWTCWSPDTALETAISRAADLYKQQANILVLTDHKPMDEKITNPRLEWHAFGTPLPNLAIVNAARTPLDKEDRCLVEIANLSGKPDTTLLSIQTGSNVLQQSRLSLASHERQRIVFNVASTTPALELRLSPDALDIDNVAQLLPPVRKLVRVAVALTNSEQSALVNRALDASGLRAALTADPELAVQDSPTPAAGSNTWSLHWATYEKPTAYSGPFIIDNSHPLADGLTLPGVIWATGLATNPPGDTPVILAGNIPLLSVHEDVIGRRQLTLNLNPELSTVTSTPDWPALFWNLLQWRISEMPGLHESNTRLGTDILLKMNGEPARLFLPDDTTRNFPSTTGQLAIETSIPGLYTLVTDGMTNRFSVNILAADESDLRANLTGEWGKWSDQTDQRLEEASLTGIFGLLALGLMVAHLWLLATGKGGR